MNQELGQSLNKRCVRCGEIFDQSLSQCPVDGIPLSEALQAGAPLFGPYTYISVIGAGGMGIIYKARHTILDRVVAVKMLRPNRLSSEEILRFQKEGKAISKLHHPGIIAVHDLGITGEGMPYMVMDFVDGISLKELIDQRGALSLTESVEIGLQICAAMAHAHSNGIVHRDLKPSNIMLKQKDGSYEAKVVDFGIAKIDQIEPSHDSNLTKTGQVFGSPAYMSPEQARGLKVEGSSDIYSVGCILFECLTGTAPYQGETVFDVLVQHIHGQPPSLTEASLGTNFPAGFSDMISKALQKDPADRFPDFTSFQDTLILLACGQFVAPLKGKGVASGNLSRRAISLAAITILFIGTAAVWTFKFFTSFPQEALEASPQSHFFQSTILPDDLEAVTSLGVVKGLVNDAMLSSDRMLEVGDINFTTECLEEIAKHKMLLGISFRHAHTIDDRIFAYIHDIPLKRLDLCDTRITDAGLKNLAKMKTLETLNLSEVNKRVGGRLKRRISYEGLAQLANLPHLRKLDLESDYLTDKDLTALSLLHHLTELDLSAPQCFSLAFLECVGAMPDLTRLRIEGLQLSFPQLASMENFAHIRSLYLKRNHALQSHDAGRFFERANHLEYLSLQETEIEGSFVRKLNQFYELGQLNLKGCRNLKRQDVLFLRRALPGCIIESDYEL